MRKTILDVLALATVAGVLGILDCTTQAQTAATVAAPRSTPLAAPSDKLEDALLEWPLPPGEQAYGRIDGRHLHQLVEEQAAISRRYRDQGHPKFWGRIIGTSADAENAAWLAGKFKSLGMSDVRIQPLDLSPQWFPEKWEVTVTGGGKTIVLDSAQPDYRAAALPPGGIDVEAVYAGMGSAADLVGKDLKGKAVFTYTMFGTHNEDAVKRADESGAVAIFEADVLPGNMRYQAYPSNTRAPAFTLGGDDGLAVRDLMASLPPGQTARVKATLDVQMVPGLKTSLVWGTLPGASDETIYIVAHRDGWFEAAGDNAAGVAAMVGLAEYYARIPQAQRRRTLVFIGLDGHHNTGPGSAVGGVWLNDPVEQGEAVRQDRVGDQLRAPVDDSNLRAPALHRRRCAALVEHVHGAAVVRRRTVTARVDDHRGESVQGLRRAAAHRTESTSAGRRSGPPVSLHPRGRDQRVLPLLPYRS